jgi:hypothetical protein
VVGDEVLCAMSLDCGGLLMLVSRREPGMWLLHPSVDRPFGSELFV